MVILLKTFVAVKILDLKFHELTDWNVILKFIFCEF